MLASLARKLHPEGFHGRNQQPPFFEGWYIKIVDATERHRYAIIPGISLSEGEGGPHSFIQVLNGATGQTLYQRYPVEAFSASETELDVRVGPNHFTHRGMDIDLTSTDLPLKGTVLFSDSTPWPVSLLAPGIMGWYAWVPRMECYHGVLSFDHRLQGTLSQGGEALSFAGGRGYIEKDWGQSFPAGWVWMQTNHFEVPHVSLTASIARIPWIGASFTGFIVGLLWNGALYRFATYTGAHIRRLEINPQKVTWVIEDDLYRLKLVGRMAEAGNLKGPSNTDMGRPVPETLSAEVDVRLTARAGHSDHGTVLFSGTGRHAGMEAAGDLAVLTSR